MIKSLSTICTFGQYFQHILDSFRSKISNFTHNFAQQIMRDDADNLQI